MTMPDDYLQYANRRYGMDHDRYDWSMLSARKPVAWPNGARVALWVVPALEAGGVDLVLCGHNHIYERSVPIFEGQEVPMGQGTMYIVSGGAGAPLYQEIDDQWFNAEATMAEHYVIGDFGPDEATFVVRDLSDNVIDQFTVPRSAR